MKRIPNADDRASDAIPLRDAAGREQEARQRRDDQRREGRPGDVRPVDRDFHLEREGAVQGLGSD